MFGSLKLGNLFGIGIYLHATFWLLPLLVLFEGVAAGDLGAAAFDVTVLFAVFGCVVLHEIGHALAARYYGIATRDITLYPVGGVASLERMPERPWHEVVVALAGPAVNVVIALGILGGVWITSEALNVNWSSPGTDQGVAFVGRLFWANVILCAFNLIPAFPMDGGRVLRALLNTRLPRVKATEIAVRVGTVFAVVGLLLGVYFGHVMWIVLAAVIFLLGRAELAAVRGREWKRRYDEMVLVEEPAAFSGWKFDPARRVWTLWANGVAVREIHGV